MDNSTDSENTSGLAVSDTNLDEYYIPSSEAKVAVVTVCGLVMLLGIVGNIFVLFVIALNQSMYSTVNRCLFALAMVDLFILVLVPIIPIGAEFVADDSHLGETMCYILTLYDGGAYIWSALIFIFVGIDRYFAICLPFSSVRRIWSGKGSYVVLTVIGIIAVGASVPYGIMVDEEQWADDINVTYRYCIYEAFEAWQKGYETTEKLMRLFIPIPCIVFLYGRMIRRLRQNVPGDGTSQKVSTKSRRQVALMLLVVVTLFVVCQVPFAVLILLYYYAPHLFRLANQDTALMYSFTWVSRLLVYANSAANPIVYFSVSSKFRQGFRMIFCSCRKSKPSGIEEIAAFTVDTRL